MQRSGVVVKGQVKRQLHLSSNWLIAVCCVGFKIDLSLDDQRVIYDVCQVDQRNFPRSDMMT